MEQETENTVFYLCPSAPFFTVKLASGKVKADKGVLKLTLKQAQELDTLMRGRGDLHQMLRKVDMEGAKEQVKRHQAAQGPAAVAGPFTSEKTIVGLTRGARAAQKSQALTGSENPINVSTIEQKPPIVVEEVEVDPPKPDPNANKGNFKSIFKKQA